MSKNEINIDDLDDYLDDVLDEFTNEPPKAQPAAEAAPESLDDEFMAMLQANMSKLLGEQNAQPESASAPAPVQPKEFQDTISQTLNKLKSSSEMADAQVQEGAELGFDEAAMQQMMKDLEGLMEGGEMDDLFGGMMNELVNRDLLYEPMKDLAEKYPIWINENSSTLEDADKVRFQAQHKIVLQIVDVFDKSTDKEPSQEEAQKILDLMQEMQTFGNPPAGLMQDMAPGLEMGPDGLPQLPSEVPDCNQM